MLRLCNKKLHNLLSILGLVFLSLISSVAQAEDVEGNKVMESASNQLLSQSVQNNSQSAIDLDAGNYNSAYDKNAKLLLGLDVSGRQDDDMAFDVVDKQGERIGILNDYLLNKEGEIKYAVVMARDLPVLDDTVVKKFVAIPIDKVLVQEESDLSTAELQVKLTLTKEQVDQLPEFVFDKNDGAQTEYNLNVRELMGMKVIDKDGNLLGVLDDLLISNNRVTYALINISGVLGSSGKLVAASFKALQINKEEEEIGLDVSEQALEDASEFQFREPY